jgi:ABC-2 type transport system permease protein
MIIATLIGTIVTLIASRFRHTNIANILLTFSLLTAYMIFSVKSSASPQALGEMSTVLSNKTDHIYLLARMYKSAVCEYNIGALLFFVIISIISFVLFSWIVGLEFKKINTLSSSARVKANYKIKTLKVEKPLIAMYKKELRRYFSSSLYVMNTAFGIVMMTIAAVALLFMRPESFAALVEVPELSDEFVFFAAAILAFCIAMSSTTACSISLEGKNLWIIKSLPVSVNTIFLSKAAVNLTITVPAILLDSIIIAIGLKTTLMEFILLFMLPTAYALFIAFFGLIVNLKFPNMNWTAEVMVIKQSAATMISVFAGMFIGAIPVVLLILKTGLQPIYADMILILLLFAATWGMFKYLNSKGKKLFLSL